MTAATLQIDLDVLDELFSNQKRLDDINLFEDDFLFGSSNSSSNKHKDAQSTEFVKSEALSLNSEEDISNWNNRNLSTFIIPLTIEVIAIYYGIMYFN